ncbi:MAG: DUF1326 domain-containing protein [Tepidiformaceae bacterium]
MAWQLSGDYFESCSCDVLCPCITSQVTARPTRGYCDAVLAFNIQDGGMDGTSLGGLNVVVAMHTDGPMGDGKGKNEVFIDSRASREQRQSLETILSGKVGGPPAGIQGLVPTFLGFKQAAITFEQDGASRRLVVDGFGEQAVSGLAGLGGKPLAITGTGHPANDDLSLARASTAKFKDNHFEIDNSGQNGHFAPFSWSG